MKLGLASFITLALTTATQVQANWFSNSNSLTQAHKSLLEGDLSAMFDYVTNSWQQEKIDSSYREHINDLLAKSLEIDCGKSISARVYPEWLKTATVTHQSVERPGRISYSLLLNIDSDLPIKEALISNWPDAPISKETEQDSSLDEETGLYQLSKEFQLNQRLKPGLYRISLSTENDQWTDWLIIYDEIRDHEVRWSSRQTWKVIKNSLLNTHCPLPEQQVTVLDYVDGEYKTVYSKSYEAEYSQGLNSKVLTPDRYVLQISMSHVRYQGLFRYTDRHVLSKTLDLTEE